MATAFLFPGQGSQTPDMQEQVREWRPDLFELVGPEPFERSQQSTRYAQPAIFCASLAGMVRLGAAGEVATAFAGHSLGELAALVAAGAIAEADALRLVRIRGAAMADAGERPAQRGGMLAVLGGDLVTIEREAASCGISVANDNSPGQVVLSGTRSGLQMVSDRLREGGARTLALDVAGAFHSPFMADAVGPFGEALAGIAISPPRVPVWSSSTARPFRDAADIRAQLPDALVRPVRWRETVLAMHADGIDRFLETGPGVVLTRLVKRTLPELAHA